MASDLLRLHEKDTVAVALHEHGKISRGHKVALVDMVPGERVIKYGAPIGRATISIPVGTWVHTHNMRTALEEAETYTYQQVLVSPTALGRDQTFAGYARSDGRVGIRNEIWIIPTVGCVNKTVEWLAREANARFAGRQFGSVFAFPHPFGCSQLGDDLRTTQRILANLAQHPNAGAVLVVGLGCENNHIDAFREVLGEYDSDRVKFFNCQDAGHEIDEGLRLLDTLVDYAERFTQEPCPVSRLVIGLKCGGSDAFSGITANPLVGAISDRLVACGGTTILTEVPEMFGAEHLLLERCVSRAVFDKAVAMITDFKDYYIRHGQPIYENPSPGNKDGGITTLEEKSLGCTQKGGMSPVVDVLPYAGTVAKPGLNLLAGPGNDIIAVTALAAAGAQLILFTTGRGTPLGGPIPTMKISTNGALASRKAHWIDYDAGHLLDGVSFETMADELWAQVLAVASGAQTRNAQHGYREIAIWKDGVTL